MFHRRLWDMSWLDQQQVTGPIYTADTTLFTADTTNLTADVW